MRKNNMFAFFESGLARHWLNGRCVVHAGGENALRFLVTALDNMGKIVMELPCSWDHLNNSNTNLCYFSLFQRGDIIIGLRSYYRL